MPLLFSALLHQHNALAMQRITSAYFSVFLHQHNAVQCITSAYLSVLLHHYQHNALAVQCGFTLHMVHCGEATRLSMSKMSSSILFGFALWIVQIIAHCCITVQQQSAATLHNIVENRLD